MVVKTDGCQLKSHRRHLTMVQNVEMRRQKLSTLARQLMDEYSVRKRKGCPASFQAKKYVVLDDVRLARVENHMPKMISNYRRCRKCSRKGQEKRTRYMCEPVIGQSGLREPPPSDTIWSDRLPMIDSQISEISLNKINLLMGKGSLYFFTCTFNF
ncbi:hypothetical protein TNCV_869391 [Trichonephila clavipes]|nr:hypothetical protein TNCV_869391 [Trichonephila clavipes]